MLLPTHPVAKDDVKVAECVNPLLASDAGGRACHDTEKLENAILLERIAPVEQDTLRRQQDWRRDASVIRLVAVPLHGSGATEHGMSVS